MNLNLNTNNFALIPCHNNSKIPATQHGFKDAKFNDALEKVLSSFELSMDSAEILYRDALKFIDDLSKDYSFYEAEVELIPPIVIHGLYDCFEKAQNDLSDAEDFYEVVKALDIAILETIYDRS